MTEAYYQLVYTVAEILFQLLQWFEALYRYFLGVLGENSS